MILCEEEREHYVQYYCTLENRQDSILRHCPTLRHCHSLSLSLGIMSSERVNTSVNIPAMFDLPCGKIESDLFLPPFPQSITWRILAM